MKTKIVPKSSVENGNTITTEKRQANKLIFHFFTWNNYPKDGADILLKKFRDISAVKWMFQEEIGKNGTRHLQGNIQLKTKMRYSELKLPKEIHWEKTRNVESAFNYCQKDDSNNGERWIHPVPIKIEKPIMTTWINYIIDIVEGEPDKRSIHWIWSEEGNMGKTTLTKYLISVYKAQFATGGKYTDIMNLIYHTDTDITSTFLFLLPREHKNHISYSALESVKDGLVSNMKSYQNGSKIFNRPNVIVLANYPPDTQKLSNDRFKVIKLLNLKELKKGKDSKEKLPDALDA